MLRIRLSRTGKKHAPHYKIVVVPQHSKRDGKVVDTLGHWHPMQEHLVLDKNKYSSWIAQGAQPSQTVRSLIK